MIYLDGAEFKHVGRLAQGGRVESKWGLGYLYDHPVWEVPEGYGQSVRYFEGPDADQGINLFIAFAKSKGFRF